MDGCFVWDLFTGPLPSHQQNIGRVELSNDFSRLWSAAKLPISSSQLPRFRYTDSSIRSLGVIPNPLGF